MAIFPTWPVCDANGYHSFTGFRDADSAIWSGWRSIPAIRDRRGLRAVLRVDHSAALHPAPKCDSVGLEDQLGERLQLCSSDRTTRPAGSSGSEVPGTPAPHTSATACRPTRVDPARLPASDDASPHLLLPTDDSFFVQSWPPTGWVGRGAPTDRSRKQMST